MQINQFLNPLEEQIHNTTTDINNIVLSQYTAVEDVVEENNKIVKPLLFILSIKALQVLYNLYLYKE